MFPAQTSLIPATVALTRFIEANGFSGVYPFWYLGSTPTKYLIGPVVPGILIGLHKLIPNFSFFDLSFFLIFTSFFLGAIGWGLFAFLLSGNSRNGVLVGVISFLMPWHWISGLAIFEVSAILANALIPWMLWTLVWSSVRNFEKTSKSLLSLLLALMLLTNSTASIPAIVGLLILALVLEKNWVFALKRSTLIILIGGVLATFWYGPEYWLTIFGAPSIGGKSIISVILGIVNFSRLLLPVILALVLVFWKIKPKSVFEKFVLSWLVIFGTWTLFRFMADSDFWTDWTSWISEIEVGLAMVFALITFRSVHHYRKSEFLRWLPSRNTIPLFLLVILYLVFGWVVVLQKRDFWLPRSDISMTVEYRIADWLGDNVRANQKVFLSGTTAFWLNALIDVNQVRGGRDEVSVDEKWRNLAWEIREGQFESKTRRGVIDAGINYFVVHTQKSEEFYHDFKNPQKFEHIVDFEKVYEEKGDIIYAVK